MGVKCGMNRAKQEMAGREYLAGAEGGPGAPEGGAVPRPLGFADGPAGRRPPSSSSPAVAASMKDPAPSPAAATAADAPAAAAALMEGVGLALAGGFAEDTARTEKLTKQASNQGG